jgi:hypothetical protein
MLYAKPVMHRTTRVSFLLVVLALPTISTGWTDLQYYLCFRNSLFNITKGARPAFMGVWLYHFSDISAYQFLQPVFLMHICLF